MILDFRTLTLVFLPHERERLDQALKDALEWVHSPDILLARFEEHDRLLDALATVGDAQNIRNVASSLMIILSVFEQCRDSLSDGWYEDGVGAHEGWVPMSTIFGQDRIPAPAAAVVKNAVDRLVDAGAISEKNRWQALELMAADTLGGR